MKKTLRTIDDYRAMFDLSESDLKRSILDYPANISCFNAQMHTLGFNKVVSADPYYDLTPLDMSRHVDHVIQKLSEQLPVDLGHMSKDEKVTLDQLLNDWNYQSQLFMSDYSDGQKEGRYRKAQLPRLPFEDFQFELALCADLLFVDDQPAEEMIMELCRVAHEVRIFPLLNETGEIADSIGPSLLMLQNKDYGIEVREVPYILTKGKHAMLRVWAKSCEVSK